MIEACQGYARTMNPYLMIALPLAPNIFSRLFDQISEARFDERQDPDRFTPREIIAHLADWEPIVRARMQSAVDNPGGPIEAFDEGKMAVDNNYRSKDIHAELANFAKERQETVTFLGLVPIEHWTQTFLHPERGPVSFSDQANMLLGHDTYHIEQLCGFLGPKMVSTW